MQKAVRIEVALSIVLSCAMNTAMTLFIFGTPPDVAVWGAAGAALDLVPTTIMTTFMSTVMPGFMSGKRLRAGALQPLSRRRRLPGNAFVRALALAAIITVPVCALLAIAFAALDLQRIGLGGLVAIKLAIGTGVPLVVTPFAVREALSRPAAR